MIGRGGSSGRAQSRATSTQSSIASAKRTHGVGSRMIMGEALLANSASRPGGNEDPPSRIASSGPAARRAERRDGERGGVATPDARENLHRAFPALPDSAAGVPDRVAGGTARRARAVGSRRPRIGAARARGIALIRVLVSGEADDRSVDPVRQPPPAARLTRAARLLRGRPALDEQRHARARDRALGVE
jgi:hypothetical protein